MEPDNIKELEDKLSKLSMEKEEAIATQDFEKAAKIRDEEKQIKEIAKWTEEKIKETYIKVNGAYRDCTFLNNWLKK